VGWRKPRRDIFDVALTRLGVPAEAALFVGDRADMDVLGAQQIGMDAAWINRDREALPAGIAPPTYEIRDLGELGPILGV
jgi:FMN phosphatase YigB (HAD superfamily)